MKVEEFIKKVEELERVLLEELETEELTDYARHEAYWYLESVRIVIEENEDREF